MAETLKFVRSAGLPRTIRFFLLSLIFLTGVSASAASSADNSGQSDDNSNAYAAGLYSAVFPGAGYFYLKQYRSALISSGLTLPIAANYYITTPDYTGMAFKKNLYFMAVNISRYQTYNVYQTALTVEDRANQEVAVPHYSFSDLYLTPFRKQSYIFGELPSYFAILPMAAVTVMPAVRIAQNGIHKSVRADNLLISIPIIFAQSFFFAVGEESYFRGFVYPAMSDLTGSRLAGNIIQAMYFGFCHTDLAERTGVRQFPHITGTLLHFTSTVDDTKEYVPPETPSGNFAGMNDMQRFGLFTTMGFAMGILVSEFDDGLIKAVLLHGLVTSLAIATDFLTEGSTGRFFMNVTVGL
jgi:membrane protease YdiL (CAAX protease family)